MQEPDAELLTFWVIQAPLSSLARACSEAGLSANAVRSEPTRLPVAEETPGELTYPSFFCPESRQWLAVLAILFDGAIPLHLYMRQVEARPAAEAPYGDETGREVSYLRIYPRLDAEMMALFRSFAPRQADRAEDLAGRVERAFAVLRSQRLHPVPPPG